MEMKILLVNTGYLPAPPISAGPLISGSIELHSYHLANELARLGNDVHYVTSVSKNASFLNGVTLHKFPGSPLSFKSSYPEITVNLAIGGSLAFGKALEAIRQNNYDIIHGQGSISSAPLLFLKKKSKYVYTVHNRTPWMITSDFSFAQAFRKVTFGLFDLRVIKNSDRVITVSENLKKEVVNRFGIDPMKVKAIPNGVDSRLFKPSIPNSASIRSKYKINHDYALFVGRLVEEKAVHTIIKAIGGTNLHAVIVGDGSLLPFLKNLSARLGVDQQIHFTGPVPRNELPKFYAQATLFVIPSSAEVGSPLAGLEAMASGLPIIATYTSGISGIVNHEYNGFITETRDTEKLRERLIQLFEDASLREIMGKRSRRIVETQYSWEQIARQTLHLYEEIA